MSISSPSPLPDHLRAAQGNASTFRALTWNLKIPVQISLAVGPTVPGGQGTKGDKADGQGYSSDIGARGGVAAGMDKYYMQCPRYTYLPIILPELRDDFVNSVLAPDELESLASPIEDWWFEVDTSHDGQDAHGNGEICKWYWPLDLIHLLCLINQPRSNSSPSHSQTLRLILHLHPHPNSTDPTKPKVSNSLEACRIRYTSLIKEADYARWGNTRRVTSLRRLDLESGWNSIVEGDYDAQAQFANKTLPLPFGLHTNSDAGSIASNTHSQSGGGGGAGGASIATASNSPDSAYAARAIPFKIYLPYNGPVIQDVSPPLNTDGKANTVKDLLYRILPGLFPTTNNDPYSLAVPYLHGVELPPDAELAWLACCSPGADGWLRIGIRLCE